MFTTIAVIVALAIGLVLGFGFALLVARNNKERLESIERAIMELKK